LAAPLVEAAPAKINLALHVTGRRPDGYHTLDTLVAFAGLGDELTALPAADDSLVLTGPFARTLVGTPDNLVLRAVTAFRARWPERLPAGLALTLAKNLPVAAGLGGGSADAAAALRLCAALAGGTVPTELFDLARSLGADVPMCLYSRPARVGGIGERVAPLAAFPACHVVLVNPLEPVATAEIFRHLAHADNPGLPALPEPLTRPAQLGLWLAGTRNDLEPAATALVPAIAPLVAELAAAPGCMLARMSGSGATVFGLFGASAPAHQAAHDLRAAHPAHWVAAAPLIAV